MAWTLGRLRRLLLPAAVFAAALGLHFLWLGLFPEQNPAQTGWAEVPQQAPTGWLQRYIETGGYWMGYTYALSFAFALVALRSCWEQQFRGARGFTIGSLSLSAILPATGCFLIGCCGSPMLAVYLTILGASVLPLVKPIVAGITTLSVVGGVVWLIKCRPRNHVCSCGPAQSEGLELYHDEHPQAAQGAEK